MLIYNIARYGNITADLRRRLRAIDIVAMPMAMMAMRARRFAAADCHDERRAL